MLYPLYTIDFNEYFKKCANPVLIFYINEFQLTKGKGKDIFSLKMILLIPKNIILIYISEINWI